MALRHGYKVITEWVTELSLLGKSLLENEPSINLHIFRTSTQFSSLFLKVEFENLQIEMIQHKEQNISTAVFLQILSSLFRTWRMNFTRWNFKHLNWQTIWKKQHLFPQKRETPYSKERLWSYIIIGQPKNSFRTLNDVVWISKHMTPKGVERWRNFQGERTFGEGVCWWPFFKSDRAEVICQVLYENRSCETWLSTYR